MLKRLVSILMLLILLSVQVCGLAEGSEEKVLQRFYYHYYAMMLPQIRGIDAKLTQDGWRATFLLGARDDVTDVTLTDADVDALTTLISTHKLSTWAGFDESNLTMLDGEAFSLEIGYLDGTQVIASGNNSFPKDYWDAQAAIINTIEQMLIAHNITY